MKTLSQEELETLREEAVGRLDEETKNNGKKLGNIDVIVKMEMEEIVGERLTAAHGKLFI